MKELGIKTELISLRRSKEIFIYAIIMAVQVPYQKGNIFLTIRKVNSVGPSQIKLFDSSVRDTIKKLYIFRRHAVLVL